MTEQVAGVRAELALNPQGFQAGLEKAANSAKSFQAKVQRSFDLISGTKATDKFKVLAAAVEKAGGTAKLSSVNFARLRDEVEKLAAAGGKVPDSFKSMLPEGAGGSIGAFGPAVQGALTGVAALAAAATAVGAAVAASVVSLVKFSSELSDMSAKTGVSTDGLQRLKEAGADSGVGLDKTTVAIEGMKKKLIESPEAFRKLGFSVDELIKMNPGDAFEKLGQKIGGIENPTLKSVAALQTMGKAGREVLPMLTKEFGTTAERAERLGFAMSKNVVGAADALGDKADLLGRTVEGLWRNFAIGIVTNGSLQEALKQLIEVVGQLSIWVKGNADTIAFWTTTAILFAVDALDTLVTVVGGVIDTVAFLTLGWKAMGIAALAVGEAIVKVIAALAKIGATASGAQLLAKVFGIDLKGSIDALADKALVSLDAGIDKLKGSMDSTTQGNIKFHESLTKVHAAIDKAKTAIVDAGGKIGALGKSSKGAAVDLLALARAAEEAKKKFDLLEKTLTEDSMAQEKKDVDDAEKAFKALEAAVDANAKALEDAAQADADWDAAQNAKEAALAYSQMADELRKVPTAAQLAAEKLAHMQDIVGKVNQAVELLSEVISGQLADSFKKATDSADGFERAVGGWAVGSKFGEKIGMLFGPMGAAWGSLIGGVIGAFAGIFSSPSWVEIGQRAGGVLGVAVGKEMAKKIEEAVKTFTIPPETAALLFIGDAIDASGRSAVSFNVVIDKLMKGVADLSVPAKEGVLAIGDAFSRITVEAKAGVEGAATELLVMIQTARALGEQVPEIMAAVKAGLDAAMKGVEAMAQGLTIVSPGDAMAQGLIFAAVFWAQVAELGPVKAALAMQSSYDAIKASIAGSGIDTALVDALFAPIDAIMALLGSDITKGLVEGLTGATEALKGLGDAGYMTAGAFQGLEQIAGSTFEKLIAQGVDSNTALQALAPTLAEIIAEHERYGTVIDDATQKLIDQAAAAGISFPTDPLQQVISLLGQLVVLAGGTLPEAAKRGADGMSTAFDNGTKRMSVDLSKNLVDPVNGALGNLKDGSQEAGQYMEQQFVSNLSEVPLWMEKMGPDWQAGFDSLASTSDPGLKAVKGKTGAILGDLEAMVGRTWTINTTINGPDGGPGPGPDRRPPRGALGALVMPRPGGTLFNVGEAGEAELVAPVRSVLQEIGAEIAAQLQAGRGAAGRGGDTNLTVLNEIGGHELGRTMLTLSRTGRLRIQSGSGIARHR